jgi:CRP-like cAMP-binding protein
MFELILANFALHVKLDEDEKIYIQHALQHKIVKKRTVLLKAGEICRNIYFVNAGCLRMYHTDSNGNEHNISFFPENWWAVDIASFSNQSPAFYSISTLENTDLFFLPYQTLEKVYYDVPKFERFFRVLTQNGFNLYQRRITSVLSKTAEERYHTFQKQYSKLEQRISQKHIASYLGITPVFLSRLRQEKYNK